MDWKMDVLRKPWLTSWNTFWRRRDKAACSCSQSVLLIVVFGLYTKAMNRGIIAGVLILVLGANGVGHSQNSQGNANGPRLIIRTDDIGFCHGVNMAFKRVAERGMVSSASVIVNH